MLGWKLLRESEIALGVQLTETRVASLAADLRATKEYVAKCERLIEHERERIDSERERADRIADSLFQSQGLPPTSVTVVAEQKAEQEVAAGKRVDYMKELLEIYSEAESDLLEDGLEPVPQELVVTAK
jgi:hypothetical protein